MKEVGGVMFALDLTHFTWRDTIECTLGLGVVGAVLGRWGEDLWMITRYFECSRNACLLSSFLFPSQTIDEIAGNVLG